LNREELSRTTIAPTSRARGLSQIAAD